MDFEEQLEKAEKLPYPSLVGSSVTSADDSAHNNYIHPEKYTGKSKSKPGKKSILDSAVGASLDDLISEGALLGSEEDFNRFLDNKGNVLSDAKFSNAKNSTNKPSDDSSEETPEPYKPSDDSSEEKPEPYKPIKRSSLYQSEVAAEDEARDLPSLDSASSEVSQESKPPSEPEIYSTPNLSEYQIGHQITDHSELLSSVKSHDLSKLPTAGDNEIRGKKLETHPLLRLNSTVRSRNVLSNIGLGTNQLDFGSNVQLSRTDSLHAPYFQNDERASARSNSRVAFRDRSTDRSRSRSRSRSAMTPHLARGDNYKYTHDDAPSKYELPAEMRVKEDEEEFEDRRSRQAKPTLADSIAAAEASKSGGIITESITRDPSLVTSGDYTNFNADGNESVLREHNLYSLRSQSSTNYLRSISRSRSRRPFNDKGSTLSTNEKNDANPLELEKEGALVTDDPYSQVDNLDSMVNKVLKESAAKSTSSTQSTPDVANSSSSSAKEDPEAGSNPFSKACTPVSTEATKSTHLGDISEIETEAHTQCNNAESETVSTESNKQEPSSEKAKSSSVVDVDADVVASVNDSPLHDAPVDVKETKTEIEPVAEVLSTKSTSNIHTDDVTIVGCTNNDDLANQQESDSQAVDAEQEDEEIPKQSATEEVTASTNSSIPVSITSEGIDDAVVDENVLSPEGDFVKEQVVESDNSREQAVESKDSKEQSIDENTASAEVNLAKGQTAESNDSEEQAASSHDTKEKSIDEKASAAELDDSSQLKSIDTTAPSTKETEVTSEEEEESFQSANETNLSFEEPLTVVEPEHEPEQNTEPENSIEVAKDPSNLITEIHNIPVNDTKAVGGEDDVQIEDNEEFEVSAEELRKHLKSLPIYIFTSLAGGMQIITRTNRLVTILQANGVKFEYRDLGTDEDAKKLWRRYAQGKTLPGVVRGDDFIGNWEFIDEVNEDYRLHEVLYETL